MVQRRPLVRSGSTREIPAGDTLFAEGFAFPAVMVPSTDPNTLDDYEELTFTPILQFGGALTGITYASGSQAGRLVKIGRHVSFEGAFTLTSKGLLTSGAVTIAGLPFASMGIVPVSEIRATSVSLTTGTVMAGYVNGQAITLETKGASGNAAATAAMLSNTTALWFSGRFLTAS